MKLRGLVIDSEYDRFRGVVSLVAVREGTLRKGEFRSDRDATGRRADRFLFSRRAGDKIASSHSGKKYEVLDLGILNPEETPTAFLTAGQVGYVGQSMSRRVLRSTSPRG